MPELPEVETIRRKLAQGDGDLPGLLGRLILSADLYWARTLASPGRLAFERIRGQTIRNFNRRAKYLLVELDLDTLVIHLRMSGDLQVEQATDPLADHARLVLNLDQDLRLTFIDPRKFGRVWLLPDVGELFAKLGPEPLEDAFTAELLHNRLHSRRRQLKPLLLDQSFLAGMGNIYTDEALHLAGLHPLMISNQLTFEQTLRLWQSIRTVLIEGIRRNGASIDWVYRGGGFQNYFQVYQRTDAPCYRCGQTIIRIVVGQRGTHLCPDCQPLPEGD